MQSVFDEELIRIALVLFMAKKQRILFISLEIAQQQKKLPTRVIWSCLFGLIIWRIWKNKNLFIFQGITWLAPEIINVSCSLAQRGNAVHLFTGGAMANDNGHASVGSVLCDHYGNWILGFTCYLGRCIDEAIMDSRITVFRKIQRIMRTKWQWLIKYIPRENNLVDNYLAKLNLVWRSNLQVFDNTSNEILKILQ
ncbi:hypothetical protein Goshw_000426 [Gossypium schwendimanii]|uniref:RNase H type-1 domain-containing protein n=1 Tax=Gossypium schwendimanii TaxID=34291 RepID=A0A7J9KZX2_GOSSC|nr:hypothetical protein [Gossypium schwendimanii]